jgi:hypothetical protein
LNGPKTRARIVDVNAQLVLDLQSRQAADDPRSWEPLVFVAGNDEKFFELYGETVSERAVVEFMLFDRRNPSSVLSCVSQARGERALHPRPARRGGLGDIEHVLSEAEGRRLSRAMRSWGPRNT